MAKIKARGVVSFAMVKYDEKDGIEEKIMTLEISESVAKRIREEAALDEKIDNPIKLGEGEDSGKFYLKVHSKYDVSIYEGGVPAEDITFTDIGVGSDIAVCFSVKDGKYKGRKYQSAYLKSINCYDVLEPTDYNPWADDSADVPETEKVASK